jgi:hypothetical protein
MELFVSLNGPYHGVLCLATNLIKQYRWWRRRNVPPLLAISIALTVCRCDTKRIAWCSMSRATLVTGHGVGGKYIPAKWHDLLKASCWSKQWLSIITQSHNHSTSDGSDIPVRFEATCYREFLLRISRQLSDWSILQVTMILQESVRTQ